MFLKKPVSWFLTEPGRKFSFAFITGSGIIFTASKFVPHTIFLDKYKEFVHFYRESKPVELSKELESRCQTCLDLLRFSDVHRKLISAFSVTGFDLFHAGTKHLHRILKNPAIPLVFSWTVQHISLETAPEKHLRIHTYRKRFKYSKYYDIQILDDANVSHHVDILINQPSSSDINSDVDQISCTKWTQTSNILGKSTYRKVNWSDKKLTRY